MYLFSFKGKVIEGNKIGRTISFPTANLKISKDIFPLKLGIYFGYTEYNKILFPSIINVGYKPTVCTIDEPVVESHLFNFNEDIYGKEIIIHFVKYIRNEIKFKTLMDLKLQLEEDKRICTMLFKK